jgi:DnaJ-class molecular chaperone
MKNKNICVECNGVGKILSNDGVNINRISCITCDGTGKWLFVPETIYKPTEPPTYGAPITFK